MKRIPPQAIDRIRQLWIDGIPALKIAKMSRVANQTVYRLCSDIPRPNQSGKKFSSPRITYGSAWLDSDQ